MILEQEGFTVGLEIGVQKGLYSEHLLKHWPSCKKFYAIDPWLKQTNYVDLANLEQDAQEQLYQETKQRLSQFGDKVVILRDFSTKVIDKFADESIDFIYIDARHDYNGVTQDMSYYYPKLKTGGIMAGHDYMDMEDFGPNPNQRWDINEDGTVNRGAVKGAVDDFTRKHGKQVVVAYREGAWSTWYFRK